MAFTLPNINNLLEGGVPYFMMGNTISGCVKTIKIISLTIYTVGAMQKSIVLFVLLFVFTVSTFAQVEEAVRYRVKSDAVVLEQQTIISSSNENSDNIVLQNRSNAQLQELGGRYGWVR